MASKKKPRFKELRGELKRLDVSIPQLTAKCGLSSSMAYAILNGEKIPSFKTIKHIRRKLKLDVATVEAWLMDFYTASKENRELAKLICEYNHFG